MAITDEMKTHLAGTPTLAVFVKLTAKDGDVLRVTNATRNKIIDGETYYAIPISPTQLQSTTGLKPDNTELEVVLGGIFTAATLRAKKWFGARVNYKVYNYKDFSIGPAIQKTGFISDTEIGKYTAKPEFLSIASRLAQPVGQTCLETCNVVRFGDTRCGKSLSGNTEQGYRIKTTAQVAVVSNRQQFTVSFTQTIKPSDSSVLLAPNDLFADGEVEFTSGNNDGLETLVLANNANSLTLWLPCFYDIQVGDLLTVTTGCNRTIDQCVGKYNNGGRFRGFWLLPGRSKIFTVPEN